MSAPIVDLNNVSVFFRHFDSSSRSLKHRLRPLQRKIAGKSDSGINAAGPTAVTAALTNFTLSLKAGERVAVIGSNASGKTTLLRVISGLLTPSGGDVISPEIVGIAMDIGVGFDLDLTVSDTLILQAILFGKQGAEITYFKEQAIEFGELMSFVNFPLRKLPPGRQGRLAIAMAIHSPSPLLLIDEVFEKVDPEFASKVIDCMGNKSHSKTALMVVGRQTPVLNELCDTAIVLEHGHILDNGPCQEITKKYQGIYVY
jgi:ABC-type polysaccharide/polyol phosphate transport system ATPase subunit